MLVCKLLCCWRRDRAEERRKGVNPDYERVNADLASIVTGNSLLEQDIGKISMEDSKFLGGDVEHTHLVKGLDYALLQKVPFPNLPGLVCIQCESFRVDFPWEGIVHFLFVGMMSGGLQVRGEMTKHGVEEADDSKKKIKPVKKEVRTDVPDALAASTSQSTSIHVNLLSFSRLLKRHAGAGGLRDPVFMQELKFVTANGRAVFTAVFNPPKINVSELFLPRRTAFVYELDGDEYSSDIPTTLRRSKLDCPPVRKPPVLCLSRCENSLYQRSTMQVQPISID